ncbi:AAA family ATPase [Paraburkholderia sp. SIMBA_049]
MDRLDFAPLNQGQQKAAEGFFEFLFGPDKELNISGPGGVGKTHLMGHLIDKVMPQYLQTCKMMGIPAEYTEVQMTATTNKAAEVLAEATGRPCETIFSFMNLVVRENYTTGKTTIEKGQGWKVHQNKIVFVDEAGMLDTPLRMHILDGTAKCKIVYVGDHCQLGPVMEAVSPIYVDELPFFELTEPMRTNNPHLQAINQQLRNTVETGEFLPIRIVPGVIDHLTDEQMEYEITQAFTEQTHEKRILAYTNKRVVQYNDHIRALRQLPDAFQIGEQLVNNSAIRLGSAMMRVEEELEIIDQSATTEMVEIAPDVELEIRRTTFSNRYSGYYRDVKVPADREHFNALLKHYKQQKNWNRFYHLKGQYPDLRQRDAATVHKAQGSTYDTVFIDLGDLSSCHNPNMAARLLYVAFSRARQRVVLYGDLAAKYGGLTQ